MASGDLLARFMATDGSPPASNYATIDQRNSQYILNFDDTTDESMVFSDVMPPFYNSSNAIVVTIAWMAASATSGNTKWNIQLETQADGGHDLDADDFDTDVVTVTEVTNAVSGKLTYTTVTVATGEDDGVAPSTGFRIKITRDADNGGAGSLMTGDAQLLFVILVEA